jgi:hypothetical protein
LAPRLSTECHCEPWRRKPMTQGRLSQVPAAVGLARRGRWS